MINLSSFKVNNPDSESYLTALEDTFSKLAFNRDDRTSHPELPFPKRLISEHYQVPPFMCDDILVDHSKLSYMINTHLTFLLKLENNGYRILRDNNRL